MINPQFLRDLARLMNRYSPEDWDALLRMISRPGLRRQLMFFARHMRDLSIEARNRLGQPPEAEGREFRKARLLRDIELELRSLKIGELREIAYRLGLQPTRKSSRAVVIDHVISALAIKDIDEIKGFVPETLLHPDAADDYSRWGRVIMGRTPQKK